MNASRFLKFFPVVCWVVGLSIPRTIAADLRIHVTNGFPGLVTRPIIQIQGYSEEPLKSISYSASANGAITENGEGHVSRSYFDRKLWKDTTNWFQVYDVELTPGTNEVMLHFLADSGGVTNMLLRYVLDYSGVTNAPRILRQWPNDGDSISGPKVTLRGYLDDPTAEIHAEISAAGKGSPHVQGQVERDGLFWIDDLPLFRGTNTVMVAMTNAAGLWSSKKFSITRSAVEVTIDPFTDAQLSKARTEVRGKINMPGYTVWVNGVKATLNPDLTWHATNVPVNEGGTATFEATAVPNSDNGGYGTFGAGGLRK